MTRFFILAVSTIALMGAATTSPAVIHSYTAALDGPSEFPPNASPGTGFAQVDYDDLLHTLHVNVVFSGLTGSTTAAHIHSATATPGAGVIGVATSVPTFPGFPSGVTFGTYDHTLDMTLASSWNPTFITANGGSPATAEAALALGLAEGKAYLNVHTTAFAAGEIRGFLVPEPATLALVAAGVLTVLGRRRVAQ